MVYKKEDIIMASVLPYLLPRSSLGARALHHEPLPTILSSDSQTKLIKKTESRGKKKLKTLRKSKQFCTGCSEIGFQISCF